MPVLRSRPKLFAAVASRRTVFTPTGRGRIRVFPLVLCLVAFSAAPGATPPPAPAPPANAETGDSPPATEPSADTEPAAAAGPRTHPAASVEPLPPGFFSAAQILSLSPRQLANRVPVKVRGQITFTTSQPPLILLRDATGGVCLMGPRDPAIRRALRPGAWVEVSAHATAGNLVPPTPNRPSGGGAVPYLSPLGKEPLDIRVLDVEPPETHGRGKPPRGPQPRAVGLSAIAPELSSTAAARVHGELLEVRGTVRDLRLEPVGPQQDAVVLTLYDAGVRAEAVIFGWNVANSPSLSEWVGARVSAQGVYNAAVPDKQQVAGRRLLLSTWRDVAVETPAEPPAALAAQPTAVVRALPEAARACIEGVVTLLVPHRGLYLQDAAGGLWVEAPSPPPLKLGDRARAVGFTTVRDGGVSLEDAGLWPRGPGQPPDATPVSADEALSGRFDGQLVQIDALVLQVSRMSDGPTLVLQAGERVFLARLAGADPADADPAVRASETSWVRATGVCVNNRSPAPTGPLARPVSFHLLLPRPEAVSVIRGPSWWTLQRVLVLTGVLVVAALLALVWVLLLRRRVALQTAQIRRHLHQETVNEERMRIARELHDSLEQDLLGITLQLKATDKLLDKPDKARESLMLASAMVRRSQAETHRAVWDLRERRSGEGLVQTLRSALAGLASDARTGPTATVRVSGTEQELSPQVENHLLRVALEAVTNAFKHAGAKTITVSLAFEPSRVTLEVADDGRGFDADHPPPPNSGHFGLFGMKERAAKLGGELAVVSDAAGTRIRLTAPIERQPIERQPADRQPVDRQPVDRGPADRASTDRASTDRASGERTPADRGATADV